MNYNISIPESEKISRRTLLERILSTIFILAPDLILVSCSEDVKSERNKQIVSSSVRWGLLVDVTKCIAGCVACVEACYNEHGLTVNYSRVSTSPQWIRKLSLRDKETGRIVNLPLMCQHCEFPPCVDVCPTKASFRRGDGVVLIDHHICIGCRYCMLACPYSARLFVHENLENQKSYTPRGKGCVESCTLCIHRIDYNRDPACVEKCAENGHRALLFGNINDPNSPIRKILAVHTGIHIRSNLRTNPSIYYTGL